MTDHEANEAAENADQRRNDEHEREQEESLALEVAKDFCRMLGVESAQRRGDFWYDCAKAVEDGRLKSRYHALASLMWEAARYTEATQRKPAAREVA